MPGIHPSRKNIFEKEMDCRVKPGNDGNWNEGHHPRFVPYLAKNICVALSTTSAMRSDEGGGAA